jgi:hypothetical protein
MWHFGEFDKKQFNGVRYLMKVVPFDELDLVEFFEHRFLVVNSVHFLGERRRGDAVLDMMRLLFALVL